MSRPWAGGVVAAAVVLLHAGAASAQFWGRPSVPQAGVCFYEDRDFRGDYFCARVGAVMSRVPYDTNDRISSIQVFGRAEVVVFRDIDFRGSTRVFDQSVRDLRRVGFNDRVSSFRVGGPGFGGGSDGRGYGGGATGWGGAYGGGAYAGGGYGGGDWSPSWGRPAVPRTGACFFEGPNFTGRYFCASVGSTTARVPADANDRISSIRLYGTVELTVFRDIDFNGQSRAFDTDLADLRMVGWNDRISSFRVTSAGRRGAWGGGGAYGGGGAWGGANWGGADYGGGRIDRSDGGRMSHAQAEAIVRRAYRSVLGREPDPGAEGWITEVMNGHLDEGRLRVEVSRSPEGRQRARQ